MWVLLAVSLVMILMGYYMIGSVALEDEYDRGLQQLLDEYQEFNEDLQYGRDVSKYYKFVVFDDDYDSNP